MVVPRWILETDHPVEATRLVMIEKMKRDLQSRLDEINEKLIEVDRRHDEIISRIGLDPWIALWLSKRISLEASEEN